MLILQESARRRKGDEIAPNLSGSKSSGTRRRTRRGESRTKQEIKINI